VPAHTRLGSHHTTPGDGGGKVDGVLVLYRRRQPMADDLHAQLGTVFKIWDQQNGYWNWYIVVNGTLVGWLVATKTPPALVQMLPLIAIYVVFVFWSLTILRLTYRLRAAAVDELEDLARTADLRSEAFRKALLNQPKNDWSVDCARHIVIDVLVVVFMVWRATG